MSSTPDTPQPVDPYTQAAAQYGLATGTASYNAGLNRTNQNNPVGSSYWTTTGGNPFGPAAPGAGGSGTGTTIPTGQTSDGVPAQIPYANTSPSQVGTFPNQAGLYPGGSGAGATTNYAGPTMSAGQGMPAAAGGGLGVTPPTYTLNTSLQPWANQELSQPLDTSGLPGMPGGPSITQNLQDTQKAIYDQQMGYLQPQEALASEQLDSQLANSGATVGSAAWNNEKDQLARSQTFANQQAANAAITGGEQEQANLFGLGTQALQNQIASRAAPINEYNSLSGSPGATANAQTPDISGAFGQQFQGQLAGYNANVASNNANTGAAGSLLASYLMYLALA